MTLAHACTRAVCQCQLVPAAVLIFPSLDSADVEDFLTKLAIKMGKLVRGGDPNLNNVAVQVINDWQRVSSCEYEMLHTCII